MFSADFLTSTSRMLFVAATPFAPVPGTLLNAGALPTYSPLLGHRPVRAYEVVCASEDETFELLSMPRASEASNRRAYCRSFSRSSAS